MQRCDEKENEKLREEVNELKRVISELSEKLNKNNETKELRSTHPPVILEKESNFDTWKQIIKNDLK